MAGTLARRLAPSHVEIIVVNAEPEFVQRLPLHQLAAGQEIEPPPLATSPDIGSLETARPPDDTGQIATLITVGSYAQHIQAAGQGRP